MIKVIKNGIVVTMAEGRPVYEKLDIVIEDDTIKELVPNYEGPSDVIEYANKKIIIFSSSNDNTQSKINFNNINAFFMRLTPGLMLSSRILSFSCQDSAIMYRGRQQSVTTKLSPITEIPELIVSSSKKR